MALLQRSHQWRPAILAAICRGVDRENELTIGYAQRTKMSHHSATTLGVITNRLRSSLAREQATIHGGEVESAIGSNVKYAGVHEEGFDGTVDVPAHSRRRFSTKESVVSVLTRMGKIRKNKTTTKSLLETITVRAHRRHMRMPARSYIRSSLAERSADYSRTISAEIMAALQGAGGQS